MTRLFGKSLLVRLGLALTAITTLAFMGMLSSVFIAETGKGDASAINQAGSLRMQSYLIAATLLQYQSRTDRSFVPVAEAALEFEQRLTSPRLTNALPAAADDELRRSYVRITQEWHDRIRPLVMEAQELADAPGSERLTLFQARYLEAATGFVAEVDALVKLIEDAAESKIERLRVIQVVTLFLTLAVVIVTLHLMHTDVLIPLRDLLTFAEKARHGDFSARVAHTSEDELGRLGKAFNVMSEDLSRKYADLEARVREKTADLAQRNRSLELLYNATLQLSSGPLTQSTYTQLLENISRLVGTGPGTICLVKHNDTRAVKLASTREPFPDEADLCIPPNCPRCFGNGTTHRVTVPRHTTANLDVLSIPIRDQNERYGVLLIEMPNGKAMQEWQTRLLETLAQNVANAITIARRDTEARRLVLLEERGIIARELHDSLAQSLSYLKIQVSRLNAALNAPDGIDTAREVIDELRDGLNSAYRQLRELLTTFRLKMGGHGLSSALEETVREFAERSGIRITLQHRLYSTELTAHEEIHTLQLVREAIANVVKHAGATEASVTLESDDDGQVTVVIEDNGVGIPAEPQRRQHYGLAIMLERAQILGGGVTIAPGPDGGTRVELVFRPQTRSGGNVETTTIETTDE